MMAFEFLGGSAHCGRPWHEYGAPFALVDCADHEASGGCGAVLETAFGGSTCHGTDGWPTFEGWPKHDLMTHEQTYYRWLERAWMGGLRLYANLFVENGVLCELYPIKRNSCDEMESVRLQVRDIYELQDYIDAQSGGPGEGFFRIVTNPFEARKVIADGKLAVVLGIEVSELFNCSHRDYEPHCNKEDIDRQLDEVYKLGVRDLELVNKFDNALAGVAGDSGEAGLVVNQGNKYRTNTYWDIETCQTTEGDKEQPALPRDALIGNGLAALLPPGSAPVYGDPPHCNTRGLTDLGEYLVRRMMEKQMIIDPDHLSQAARDEVIALIESKDYSGLFSSHSWSNEKDYPRIYRSGGVVAPSDNSTDALREGLEAAARTARPPLPLRARLRRRHERHERVRRAARRGGSDQLPVQVVRRRRDDRQAAERRAHVRHQRGRHRPLRPLPRLGRGPAPARRRRDRRRHGERRRGVPADVGARRGRARAALPLAHEQPAPRGRALHRARPPRRPLPAPRRPAAAARRPRLALVREEALVRQGGHHRRPHAGAAARRSSQRTPARSGRARSASGTRCSACTRRASRVARGLWTKPAGGGRQLRVRGASTAA